MKIRIERTKKGLPALWEEGGGYTRTGDAKIICGPGGEPLKPLYVRQTGHLSNDRHTLFVIREGYHVIAARYSAAHGGYEVEVFRIVEIGENEATTEKVAEYSQGEWEPELPGYLMPAIQAAIQKTRIYHCRRPIYYANEVQNGKE
jgi:hypothetical protein